MLQHPGNLKLTHAIFLCLVLALTACGAGFEEGVYSSPNFNTTYEFGPDGNGRMIGGVPGTPAFTYKVESDRVIVSYGKGQPEAVFKRVDNKTLERHDGARLMLRE